MTLSKGEHFSPDTELGAINGPKRGTKPRTKWLKEALIKELKKDHLNTGKKKFEVIAEWIVKQATLGNDKVIRKWATTFIYDRVEGKPVTTSEITQEQEVRVINMPALKPKIMINTEQETQERDFARN